MKRQESRWPRGFVLAVSLLSVWTTPAWAQRAESTHAISGDEAWSQGISVKDRQRARSLFLEGNKALEDSSYSEAEKSYRQALRYWDHPAIHYNLAMSLVDSDQSTEVYQHLTAAMRYGPGPLDSEKYNHALEYKERLEKKMTLLDIKCDVPGATVMLDGQPLFQAPSHFEGLLHPGVHSLAASKPGLVSIDQGQSLTMTPGGRMKMDLKLYTLEEITRYRTRWAPWMPWAAMGSGLAVAAGGGLLYWQTQQTYNAFDAKVMACRGCAPDATMQALRTRGDTMQKAAMGSFALGGAGFLTGTVLLFLNQRRPYYVNPESGETLLNFSPLLGNATGVQATLRH